MDKHIAVMVAQPDDDLMICAADGVAYQRDMTVTMPYDRRYFEMYAGYENNEKADAIDGGRIDFVARHVGFGVEVCDVGIGAGVFIKKRERAGGPTFGVDVNPVAIDWLKERGLWAGDQLSRFSVFTFWDVLEHLPDPAVYLDHVPVAGWVFASTPIYPDLGRVRESKHYKPGEHLLYFTEAGFVGWMAHYGFELRERATFESDAGRDSIGSFAFERVRRG